MDKKYKINCHKCGAENELSRSAWWHRRKYGTVCKDCAAKENAKKWDRSGSNNPFYGKKVSQAVLDKMAAGRSKSDKFKGKEFSQKMSKINGGKNNYMHGKTMMGVWIQKYGEEVAREKQNAYSKKVSVRVSGENNPMYGKPAPMGSGNGWKGWYNGHFFRSLRELSYAVDLDTKGQKWETAERKWLRIKYVDFEGHSRNHYADFLVEGHKLVEIKPVKLQDSKSVMVKKQAAEQFCKDNGLSYEIIDPKILEPSHISRLISAGVVIFMDKYKERINSFIKEHSNDN